MNVKQLSKISLALCAITYILFLGMQQLCMPKRGQIIYEGEFLVQTRGSYTSFE